MKERILTCIVCPRGCTLTATLDERGHFSDLVGNACKRGVAYAEAECTHPTRTVTSTVRCEDGVLIAVKTDRPIPKELIFEAMECINKTRAGVGTKIGDILIENIAGTDACLVATSNHGSAR